MEHLFLNILLSCILTTGFILLFQNNEKKETKKDYFLQDIFDLYNNQGITHNQLECICKIYINRER